MGELLDRLEIERPGGIEPGERPVMTWVKVGKLRVDRSYQRPVTGRGVRTIEEIVREFRWSRFSPLIVARGKGGTFNIVDGQHRAIAAMVLGFETVPASVLEIGPDEQAKVFASINGNVTPMTILQLFKAARLAGEEWAVEVDRVCRRAGIEPLVYPVAERHIKPFQTMAIGTIRDRIRRFGAAVVEAALRRAKKVPGADVPGYWRARRIDEAITRYRDEAGRHAIVDTPADVAKVRELAARKFTRQQIAAATGFKYSEIEDALRA